MRKPSGVAPRRLFFSLSRPLAGAAVACRPGSRFTDPDAAARKLVEIANATEAVQDGLASRERFSILFVIDISPVYF